MEHQRVSLEKLYGRISETRCDYVLKEACEPSGLMADRLMNMYDDEESISLDSTDKISETPKYTFPIHIKKERDFKSVQDAIDHFIEEGGELGDFLEIEGFNIDKVNKLKPLETSRLGSAFIHIFGTQ